MSMDLPLVSFSAASQTEPIFCQTRGPSALTEEVLNRVCLTFSLTVGDTLESCFAAAYQACKQEKWSLVESVKTDLDAIINREGRTILLEALHRNDHELAQKLMEKEVTLHIRDRQGNHALHYSVRTGQKALVQKMQSYIPLDDCNGQQQTPLHTAAEYGHSHIVQQFLASGANTDAAAVYTLNGILYHNISPLWIATIKGKCECAFVLEQYTDKMSSAGLFMDFHEDALPTGQFVVAARVIEVKDDGLLVVYNNEEEMQRRYFQFAKQLESDPALLLAMSDTTLLPFAHSNHFKFKALEKLVESVDEEVKKLHLHDQQEVKKKGKKEDEDLEKLSELIARAENLKKKLTAAKKEKVKIERQWQENLHAFYKKTWAVLFSGDLLAHKDFFDLFYQLRTINPQSLKPFYPFLTILSCGIKNLKDWIKVARDCDPYLTYAFILFYIRLSQQPFAKKSYLFEYFDAMRLLKVLKELYPDDRVIPAYIHALQSPSQVAPRVLPKVAQGLSVGLSQLAAGTIDTSIKTLVALESSFTGFSTIHRLVGIAWALKGDIAKATQLLKRASQLLELSDTRFPPHLVNDLFEMFGKKEETSPYIESREDLSKFFLEMVSKESPELLTIEKFINHAVVEISETTPNEQGLIIIYFGVEWLATRLVPKVGQFDWLYRPIFDSLFELMSRALTICFRLGKIDPWIEEHVEKRVEEDRVSFLIDFPGISFGALEKRELPLFKFFDDLTLKPESSRSLATCISKQAHNLLLGLMTSHSITQLAEKIDEPFPPADNPTIFNQLLELGFTAKAGAYGEKSNVYEVALHSLEVYLDKHSSQRPYALSPQILDWAKFSVFSHQARPLASKALEKDLLTLYYFPDFSDEQFQKGLICVKSILKLFTAQKGIDSLAALALRDVWLADYQSNISFDESRVNLSKMDNPYVLFRLSQHLFGWHANESFEAWGDRLQEASKRGPAASSFHRMEELYIHTEAEREVSPIPQKIRDALNKLLQFWLHFHQTTKEKNSFIAAGGDENEEEKSVKVKDWSKGIELKKWEEIIKKNNPAGYPGKLTAQERAELTDVVVRKHDYGKEVLRVRELCDKARKEIHNQDSDLILAAVLVASCEIDRDKACHSIFVQSQAEALRIYRILLHVSADRLVRNALVMKGANGWMIDMTSCIDNLVILLEKFHGPERHPSGYGPLQVHYNAGVITSGLSSINTHLYFES